MGVSLSFKRRFLIQILLKETAFEMSNTTASDVANVHGQNPQYLVRAVFCDG